jgi:hypothetical protein
MNGTHRSPKEDPDLDSDPHDHEHDNEPDWDEQRERAYGRAETSDALARDMTEINLN